MKIGVLISSQIFEAFSGAGRIEEAGKKMGHEVHRLLERRISFEENDGLIVAKYDGRSMPSLDVIIVRPNFVEEPSQHQYVYELLRQAGYKLVNGGAGVTRTKNKILQRIDLYSAKIPMPKWATAHSVSGCLEAIKTLHYPVVIKMAFGTRGRGVFYADSDEVLVPIVDYLNVRDGNPVIIEEFIEEAKRSHLRAFVIGDNVVGAMEVVAVEGDIRSNAGGSHKPVELTQDEWALALKATKTMGLEVAGVDLIRSGRGTLLLEVNANPGFQALEKTIGTDIAAQIIEFSLKSS